MRDSQPFQPRDYLELVALTPLGLDPAELDALTMPLAGAADGATATAGGMPRPAGGPVRLSDVLADAGWPPPAVLSAPGATAGGAGDRRIPPRSAGAGATRAGHRSLGGRVPFPWRARLTYAAVALAGALVGLRLGRRGRHRADLAGVPPID